MLGGYQGLVLRESAESLVLQNSAKGTALHDIYYKVKHKKIPL